jgi:Uncharacterized protein conserved in bacteria
MPRDRQIICDVSRRSVSNPYRAGQGGTGARAAGIFRRSRTQKERLRPDDPANPRSASKPAPPQRRPSRPPGSGNPAQATTDPLSTDDGKISVAQGVVQKIAGIACREISGVHAMGARPAARSAQSVSVSRQLRPNVAQGVGVEVGETQAAIDLDIVVEYGVSIADLGRSIQRNVKQAVERMTGLDVVEVNVTVDDLYLPGSGDEDGDAPSRVS